MRKKRILSMLTVAILIASQISMVAFADGGTVTADVTTQNAIVRVQVPTTMAVAIDQFEISQTGAQINSSEFQMVNNSQMAVKVEVASTATISADVDLVATTTEAEDSEASTGEAWLAVAAASATSSVYTNGDETNWYDLTDVNANVTSFAATEDEATTSAADQTFYLAKGSDAETYKLEIPTANATSSVSYAKLYELTADATATDQDKLTAAIAAHDVYVIVTDDIGTNGTAVTKIAKGGTGTYAGTNTYYTVAETETAVASLVKDSLYVWGAMATAGGEAAFRYIGSLGNAKATWTKDDISGVSIAYTITGVTGTNYTAAATNCVYGFYTEPVAEPEVTTITGTTITNSGATTTYSTSAELATRLASGAVAFHMATDDVTTLSELSVSKITIDGIDYASGVLTVVAATSTDDCDGQTYALTGFTAETATAISVYYGTTYVVTYTLSE